MNLSSYRHHDITSYSNFFSILITYPYQYHLILGISITPFVSAFNCNQFVKSWGRYLVTEGRESAVKCTYTGREQAPSTEAGHDMPISTLNAFLTQILYLLLASTLFLFIISESKLFK